MTPHDLQDRYARYLQAFNEQDFDALAGYVDEHVFFDWRGRMPSLDGREAMFGFYREAFHYLTERLTARNVRVAGDVLIADVENRLHVFKDWLDGPLGPMYAGDRILTGDVRYTWANGKVVHII